MNREPSPADSDDRTRLLTERSASETRDASARSSLELQTLSSSEQYETCTPTATGLPEALQAAVEARRVADEALKAVLLLKASLQEEQGRAKKEESKLEAREKEQRSRWFPWLSIALTANLMLWLSMLYMVFRIDESSTHRSYFLTATWIIFATPLLIACVLLVTPYPRFWRRRLIELSEGRPSPRYSRIANMLNALACFTLVLLYLYASVIPVYNTPEWSSGIGFVDSIQFPGLVFWLVNPLPVGVELSIVECVVGLSSRRYKCAETAFRVTDDLSPSTSYLFNSSELLPEYRMALTKDDYVQLVWSLTYNSTLAKSSDIVASQILFDMWVFDSRHGFNESYSCDLTSSTLFQVLAENFCTLTASLITDTLGLIQPSTGQPDICQGLYQSAFSSENPQYTSYASAAVIQSDQFTLSNCDTVADPTNTCDVGIEVQFGSLAVSSMESVPGIKQLDIWLNAGAIVGAVQFFAWFLGIFNT